MFEALVITLREGVEAALVLAIALAVLRRRGMQSLVPALFLGTVAAHAVSAVTGVLLSRIPFNEELTEGVTMIAGAILVFGLVAWMWQTGPNMRQEIEAGRKLFASPWDFLSGAGSLASLPPARGVEIAFAGRSNVGKSSLVNALTSRKSLARTSKMPGRTQQINFFKCADDLVLADPPYERWTEVEPELATLLPAVVAPSGLAVVETSARVEPRLPLDLVTSRRYGSARLTVFAS